MYHRNTPTDDEMLAIASQDRPISRDELGIQTPSTIDGLRSLNEGFNFLQFNNQSKDILSLKIIRKHTSYWIKTGEHHKCVKAANNKEIDVIDFETFKCASCECYYSIAPGLIDNYKYCPNCGLRMHPYKYELHGCDEEEE